MLHTRKNISNNRNTYDVGFKMCNRTVCKYVLTSIEAHGRGNNLVGENKHVYNNNCISSIISIERG